MTVRVWPVCGAGGRARPTQVPFCLDKGGRAEGVRVTAPKRSFTASLAANDRSRCHPRLALAANDRSRAFRASRWLPVTGYGHSPPGQAAFCPETVTHSLDGC